MVKFFSVKRLTMLATFSAISVAIYFIPGLSLPIFPGFLHLHISDMPALLAGYLLGPLSGVIVLLIRSLFGLLTTWSAGIGELADFIIGCAFVLPAALIYARRRKLSGAVISLIVGILSSTAVAMLINWAFLIRAYSHFLPFESILKMVQLVFPKTTEQNFYLYYTFFAVMPFNLLRGTLSALVTFLIYKSAGKFFEKLFSQKPRGRKAFTPAPPIDETPNEKDKQG